MLLLPRCYLFLYLRHLSLLTILHSHKVNLSSAALGLLMSRRVEAPKTASIDSSDLAPEIVATVPISSPAAVPPEPSLTYLLLFVEVKGLLLIFILFTTFCFLPTLLLFLLYHLSQFLRQFRKHYLIQGGNRP